ncbi:MAG: hypothetical protein JWP59_1272 [Massilia sp.]|nr:hypothetical protein [Massilia sp.]
MDQQKLRTLVFEKTGVKIDVDDPVFALVALNEAVLQEAVERHVAMIDGASDALAARLGVAGVAPSTTPAAAAANPPWHPGWAPAAGAAVLGAILVLLGQALWFKPALQPPVIQAKELSLEQSSALRQAEKLDKIVQKLDPKTRAAIRAEMQKP